MSRQFRTATSALARTAAAALVALLSMACAAEAPPSEPVIRPVRAETVAESVNVRERVFSGVAEATTVWNGSFKVPGTIETLGVAVGEAVARDQVLAQLDPYDYELEVQRAEASLQQARANARNAAATFQRTRELYENENATQADYDAARAADESASEAVRSAEKTLELAVRRSEYTSLRAPISGAIAEVPVEENENVNAGQVVVRMTAGDRRQVSVAIPEAFILEVRQGDAAMVRLDALGGRTYPATVDEVGVASIGMATTFPVTVIFDEETPEVRSGMAADVTFQFRAERGAPFMSVPMAAVLEDRAGNYVFVLEPGANGLYTTRRRAVTVGSEIRAGDQDLQARLVILSGLDEGDVIVTAGAKRVVDGQQVRRET